MYFPNQIVKVLVADSCIIQLFAIGAKVAELSAKGDMDI
jgi:hypothetical protein